LKEDELVLSLKAYLLPKARDRLPTEGIKGDS
jgi:hypothetical protein